MGLLKDLIGLGLVFISWYNPLDLSMFLRIAIFVVGFDLMGIFMKIVFFLLNLLFPFFGPTTSILSWILVVLMGIEIILSFLKIMKILLKIVKPAIVGAAIYFVTSDLQLALIAAGIDLVLNLKR